MAGSIVSSGSLRWSVSIPLGRDPVTGKQVNHWKSLRGSKRDAQLYVDWFTGLLNSGQAITATVSQSELRMLESLQRKADQFRATLQAAVRDGAIVEPGVLELPAPAAGVQLPEKRSPRTVDSNRTPNRELLRPLRF